MAFVKSLKGFINVVLVVSIFIPVLITGCITVYTIEKKLTVDIINRNVTLAGSLANEIEFVLNEPYSILVQLKDNIDENRTVSQYKTDEYLMSIIKSHEYFESIEILDSRGSIKNIAPYNNEFLGISRASQDFFIHTSDSGKSFWSPTFISLQTGQPTLTLTMPFKDGMAVGYFNLKRLIDIVDRYRIGKDSFISVIDSNGVFVSHTDKNKVNQRETEKYYDTIKKLSKDPYKNYRITYDGHDMIISTEVVKSTNWLVVICQSRNEAFEPVTSFTTFFFICILLSFCIALLISVWGMKSILQPLIRLCGKAREIAAGNYNTPVPNDSFVEYNNLAEDFNSMASSIKSRESEIKRLNEELEQRVTERTRQLEEANRELESFSYSVSHDLRAPLRGIDGFSQALIEDYTDKLGPEGSRYLERIRSGVQRMGHLIDDLLNLSRIGRSELHSEMVDLSGAVCSISEQLTMLNHERNVEFVIEKDVYAFGDKRLLTLALENLINNSWKFTSKQSQARIEFGMNSSDDQWVYFVKDNGCGFDMAYYDKLFGAFQRLHSANDFEGNGIGLANVQRIIQRHGGRIWAESEVDKGTVFYFIIS